jgi:hypothetical protein
MPHRATVRGLSVVATLWLVTLASPLSAQPVTTPVNLAQYQHVRYVSASTGSDATGTGTMGSPWQSLTQAFNVISDASLVNAYAVLLAEGAYVDKGETSFAQDSWVDLYGGFDPADWSIRSITEHETILDGERKRRVIVAANHSRIDGLTVRNGLTSSGGGGILYAHVDSATLSNCTVKWCRGGNGGGVDCYYSSPSITHCRILSNGATSGGALSVSFDSTPRIEDCTMDYNAGSWAGAVFCDRASLLKMSRCNITDNHTTAAPGEGGGIYSRASSIDLTNCNIVRNRTQFRGGGVSLLDSKATFAHCKIATNVNGGKFGEGGGISGISSELLLSYCSIDANYLLSDLGLVKK